MVTSWYRFAPLVFSVSLLIFAGCSSSDTAESLGATVSGSVTYNGSPVDGAMVTFRPASEGAQGAFARTDAEGKYELSSSAAATSGVVPGEYNVTVTKTEVGQSNVASEEDPDYNPYAAGPSKPKSVLPKKYADAKTSGLEFTVTSGENDLPIELTD